MPEIAAASRLPLRVWGSFAALTLLFVLVAGLKIDHSTSLPGYDPEDGGGFHWTESAFHFRHAAMVATGEGIPRFDVAIQSPEGLDTRRFVTPVMEGVYGRLYRWFGGDVPLHVFLIWATAIGSTFSVVACFGAGWTLGRGPGAGLVAATLYAAAPASFARNAGQFVREDFALPFLFGSFACLLACMRRERPWLAVAGAVLLVVGLASWHVTQFYYTLVVAALVVVSLVDPDDGVPRRTFTIYAGVATLAALLLPVLRAKQFAISPALLMSAALIIAWWGVPRLTSPDGWSPRRKRLVVAGLVVSFAGVALVVQGATGAQSHVRDLLWAKVRFLGQWPSDPSVLSFESRAMWTSAFVSPTALEIVVMLSAASLFAAIGLGACGVRLWRRVVDPAALLVAILAVATTLLFMLVQRMSVLAIFFLALAAVLAWPPSETGEPRARRTRIALWSTFGLCLTLEAAKLLSGVVEMRPQRPSPALVADVLEYLRTRTTPDATVLATYELGPSIAAYAGRPVTLHPKFESPGLRAKVEEVYGTLLEDEVTFEALCRRLGVQYVVHRITSAIATGPGSLQYLAGHAGLPTTSVVFAFQFAPETLTRFRLTHQNREYRVFRVGPPADRGSAGPPYEPVYDPSLYIREPAEILTAEKLEEGWRRATRVAATHREARELARAGEHARAIANLERALEVAPRHAGMWHDLAEVRQAAGGFAAAATALEQAIQLEPGWEPVLTPGSRWAPESLVVAAMLKNRKGAYADAERFCRLALGSPSSVDWRASVQLGVSLAGQGRRPEAIDALREALRTNPGATEARALLDQLTGDE